MISTFNTVVFNLIHRYRSLFQFNHLLNTSVHLRLQHSDCLMDVFDKDMNSSKYLCVMGFPTLRLFTDF